MSYVIFWGGEWQASDYGNSQEALTYLGAVGGSPFGNILTQYYDGSGHISNNSRLIAAVYDPSAPPTDSTCGPNTIQDQSAQAEISVIRRLNGWTATTNATYYLYIPAGFAVWSSGCSNASNPNGFCGYHDFSTFDNGQGYAYAVIVYPVVGCYTSSASTSDALVSTSAHEQFEAITDPVLNAWYDSANSEVGDKCVGADLAFWIGNNQYSVQQMYSNAAHACVPAYPTSFDGVCYQAHIQNLGWLPTKCDGQVAGTTGFSLRMEALTVNLTHPTGGAGVCYQAHVQNIGWQAPVCNGAMAGTTGQSLRMEAVKIWLVNAPPGSHICYQAHVQNIGWQGTVCDGAMAGTTGQSLRMEAIIITVSFT